jgi:light-regulated signal transduction histidine kinase (bacteriophytochrome)
MRVDRDRVYAPINHLVMMVGGIGLLVLTPMTGFGVWTSWKLIQEDRALTQTSQALERSVVELTRSNADLQQFAYVASHDLQEPLRMVASYTQLLAKRYKGKLDADADEFITFAVEGATRMQQLIKDLLAYSRVTTQRAPSEPTECAPALVIALNNLHMAIEKEQAVVTYDPLPTIVADDTQLTQLFQNLIGNAIKFRGDQPPRVHLSAIRKDHEWVFAVRDNGIGIDPQYADRVFVIFQRLHTPADYPGTGIGLALCKKIVERHGGRIWVDSSPGQGATFYFTFPFSPTPSTAGVQI